MANTVSVEFDEGVHSLDALNAAAYRMIDIASCRIEKRGQRFFCHLTAKDSARTDIETLQSRFLDYVTDEAIRERIAPRVQPLRNLILSLAFGPLVPQAETKAE
jgi:His-Xaa-Ser system protein HxsD